MHAAITDMELDLSEICVLTEAASGAFAVTCLIAALAGAERVFAVAKDSHYGTANDVIAHVGDWAQSLGVIDRIELTAEPARRFGPESHLVTNAGFVRPITGPMIRSLPPDAAIALMFEPWEFRRDDLDLTTALALSVPVVGTNETHPRVATFAQVGRLARVLIEETIGESVAGAGIVVIGSDPFGGAIEMMLAEAGAQILRLVSPADSLFDPAHRGFIETARALVLAEHRVPDCLVGPGGVPLDWIGADGPALIHISGVVDQDGIEGRGLRKIPPHEVRPGYMGVTPGYLGPEPVIDLNTAGLRAGEVVVRARRAGMDTGRAIAAAVDSGFGLAFEERR